MNKANRPLVSAIITTRNRRNDLAVAIASVTKQTYVNIELIVVDDASDDGMKEYGEDLLIKGVKYIYIDKQESRGGNYARNIGIKNAKGEYIAFLDDDDEWLPEKIEFQMQCVSDRPECGLIYSGFTASYDNAIFNYSRLPNRDIKGNLLNKQLYLWPYFNTSVMLVKREILEQIGGFDEKVKYWQEYELMLRVIQHTEVAFVNKPLVRINRSYSQKGRLTNKLDGWIEAVEYINNKHKTIFEVLTEEKKARRNEYFYKEAAYRASLNNDKEKMKKYYMNAYIITPKLEYLIRGKLGLTRKSTLLLETMLMRCIYIMQIIRGNR